MAGGRAKSKKTLVAVAVERVEPKGFGRCRMAPIPDASAQSLRAFLFDNVQPGAKVISDGWRSYPSATKDTYEHEPLKGASGADASKLLPGGAQGLLTRQAMAPGHPPGVGGSSTSARVPQ